MKVGFTEGFVLISCLRDSDKEQRSYSPEMVDDLIVAKMRGSDFDLCENGGKTSYIYCFDFGNKMNPVLVV